MNLDVMGDWIEAKNSANLLTTDICMYRSKIDFVEKS